MTSTKTTMAIFTLLLSATASHAADFSFKFQWCDETPEFSLSNVPKGTTKLNLKMVDRDVPSYPHGGGNIEFKGQKKIECGALGYGSYEPPSPPSGSHTYEWTIIALDKDGKELASAKASRKFPEM